MEGVERGTLGEAIDRRRRDIIDRWLHKVREDQTDHGIEATSFVDGIEDYLMKLGELLRIDDLVDTAGEQVWVKVAKAHAITRVQQGFDVDQLIHEFVLLRKVLIDVLEEEQVLSHRRQSGRIVDLIEVAVKVAVRSYVEHRDYQAKRIEAEHIGFVTHELRNPLNTASLSVDQLYQVLPPTSAPQQHLYQLIRRSHARLRSLIDRVLLVERLDAGEMDSRPVSTTMGEILEPLLPGIIAGARAKGLIFDSRFDREASIQVDPLLTGSAVQNLLDNAVKYTDHGRVELVIEDRSDQLAVHVRDQCGGIAEEGLATLFEPFRRGSTRKPGSGLGLAIARRAVETQGGSIGGESSPERGGCHFWFTLPKPRH